jgi:hypothetical protein
VLPGPTVNKTLKLNAKIPGGRHKEFKNPAEILGF